jgi:hypothetical protein
MAPLENLWVETNFFPRSKMDFFRHGSGVPWLLQRAAPSLFLSQGPFVSWAHRRPGYPLSGCVPAEPNSVSPGQKKLPEESHRFKCPGTPEPCLENPRGSGVLVPRNLSRWPRRVEMASPANVTLRKERGLCTIEASDHPQILRTSRNYFHNSKFIIHHFLTSCLSAFVVKIFSYPRPCPKAWASREMISFWISWPSVVK